MLPESAVAVCSPQFVGYPDSQVFGCGMDIFFFFTVYGYLHVSFAFSGAFHLVDEGKTL